MDKHWRVLARIPDLNTFSKDGPSKTEETSGGLSAIGSRILNQSLSVKLLSGLALALVVVSILPIFSGGKEPATDALPMSDTLSEWPAASEEARIAQTSAPRPMTLVPAAPENSFAPEKIPLADDPRGNPAAKDPLVSTWPKPAQPGELAGTPGAEPPGTGASRPMAVRPNEYQADARSTPTPRSSNEGPREHTNENPASGNSYDSTRPSAY